MATLDDFGKKYGRQIRTAINEDIADRSLPSYSWEVPKTKTYKALKEVAEELDSLVDTTTNRPLTDAQKGQILEQAGMEVGRGTATDHRGAVKSASNDQLADLLDYIKKVTK